MMTLSNQFKNQYDKLKSGKVWSGYEALKSMMRMMRMMRIWCVEKLNEVQQGFSCYIIMVEEQIPLKVTIIANKQEMSQQATEEVQLIMFFA